MTRPGESNSPVWGGKGPPPLPPRPGVKDGQGEALNPAQRTSANFSGGAAHSAPVRQSRLGDKLWLPWAVTGVSLCALAGVVLWTLPDFLAKFRVLKPEIAPEPVTQEQGKVTPPANALAQVVATNSAPLRWSDQVKVAAKEKPDEAVLPVRKKKDPKIAFVSASALGDSIYTPHLYGNTTTGFLYRTSGEVEELSPVRSGLKNDYAFKTRDGQWRMVASKNGKLLLESTTDNVALVRLAREGEVLFIAFAPMKLMKKAETSYGFLHEFKAYREVLSLCQTARVHLAMRGHPEICCDIDAPVQLQSQGVRLSLEVTDAYKRFITRNPAPADIQKMNDYPALLKPYNNDIVLYLATTPAGAEQAWEELDKVSKGGKTGLAIADLPHRKYMAELYGNNHTDPIKKNLDEPLNELREKYNGYVSMLEDRLRQHHGADVAQNIEAILQMLKDSTPLLNGLKPKPDAPEPDKLRYRLIQALFSQDLADLQKKVEDWKEALNLTALVSLQNQAGKRAGVTETTVVKCECKISNTVVWAWSAMQP